MNFTALLFSLLVKPFASSNLEINGNSCGINPVLHMAFTKAFACEVDNQQLNEMSKHKLTVN